MEALVVTPQWFRGFDIVLEVITMLIALGVVYAGVKAWRLTQERKHLYFAGAFGLIALSFAGRLFALATIALNSFSEDLVEPALNALGVGWQVFTLGRIVYAWLVLTAYAVILTLALRWHRKRDFGIVLALTTVITATTIYANWPFYLGSLAVVFWIALQYYLNHAERRSATTFAIFCAFALLALEPLMHLLAVFEPALVPVGYGVRLVAYLAILRTLWRVLSHEPKA